MTPPLDPITRISTTPSASTATSATYRPQNSKRPTLADKPTTHWLETNKPSLHKPQCDSDSATVTRRPSWSRSRRQLQPVALDLLTRWMLALAHYCTY